MKVLGCVSLCALLLLAGCGEKAKVGARVDELQTKNEELTCANRPAPLSKPRRPGTRPGR